MGAQWKQAGREINAQKRGQLVVKLVREIMVAAKTGGPEVDLNARLAAAVEKAKKASVTRDTIERAIKKGAGIGDEKISYELVTYEGFAPHKVPPLPEEALVPRGWSLWWRVLKGMVPSIVLIFLVLGTIFLGLATPTEAGAMGAVGAVVLAMMNGRFTWKLMREAMANTMRLTSMVIFILIGARVFSLTFYGVNGHIWVEELLTATPGGETGFLIVVNIMVFFLAFFPGVTLLALGVMGWLAG